MDVDFELFEVKFPQRAEKLIAAGLLPAGKPMLTSSDAHCIEAVGSRMSILGDNSPCAACWNRARPHLFSI